MQWLRNSNNIRSNGIRVGSIRQQNNFCLIKSTVTGLKESDINTILTDTVPILDRWKKKQFQIILYKLAITPEDLMRPLHQQK